MLEKIRIDGEKIQEKGNFEMYFEKNASNLRLIRKIEKHEIISDYILKENTNFGPDRLEVVPFSGREAVGQPLFPDDNSRLEVQYYQNFQKGNTSHPIIEQKIVSLRENPGHQYPYF